MMHATHFVRRPRGLSSRRAPHSPCVGLGGLVHDARHTLCASPSRALAYGARHAQVKGAD